MVRFISAIAFLSNVLLAISTPVSPLSPDSNLESRASKYTAADLQNEMKAIWWEEVLTTCNDTKIEILVRAARDAIKIAGAIRPNDEDLVYSEAWTRYFGDYNAWMNGDHSPKGVKTAATLVSILESATRYIQRGGEYSQEKPDRVIFTCDKTGLELDCSPTNKVSAVAVNRPDGSVSPKIHFCDHYFDNNLSRHMHDIIKAGDKGNTDIAQYQSYEAVMLHEFMHIDMINKFPGGNRNISDIYDSVKVGEPKQYIYGEENCRNYAIKYGKDKRNIKVPENADNYAWFFTYYYLHKRWWAYIKTELKRTVPSARPYTMNTRREIQERQDGEEDNDEMPKNCYVMDSIKDKKGHSMLHCDPLFEPYDQWVKNLKKPFKSSGNCDLSAECRRSINGVVDLNCKCSCDGKDNSLTSPRCGGFAGIVPKKEKTNAFTIFVKSPNHFTPTNQSYIFIKTNYLEAADGCSSEVFSTSITEPSNIVQLDTPKFVKGDFEFKIFSETFEYSANNDEGSFINDEMVQSVKCSKHGGKDDPGSSKECGIANSADTYWVHPIVYCEW